MLNCITSQIAYSQSDTICFEKKQARILLNSYVENDCNKIDLKYCHMTIIKNDIKNKRKNTAIGILAGIIVARLLVDIIK